MKIYIKAFLFCITILILSGCSAGNKISSDTSSINNKWVADSINGIKTDSTIYRDAFPFLKFNSETGTVTGSTGCNTLNGSLNVTGSTIKISDIITTKMFCIDIDEITFLDILKKTDNYEIRDGKLYLYSGKDLKMVLKKEK
jgi:heat shock protein HslJ